MCSQSAAGLRSGRGAIGRSPCRSRCSAARIVGVTAHRRSASPAGCVGSASQSGGRSSAAPVSESAVRRPLSGVPPAAAISGQRGRDGLRHPAQRAPSRPRTGATAAGSGSAAVDHEGADVREAAGAGQLDRGVLAVVVEALVAADVAEVGGGDHHAAETAGGTVVVMGRACARSSTIVNIDTVNIVTRLLTTAEVARRLDVQPATVYAYVSRGLLTNVGGRRASRFAQDEVDRLVRRGREGRRPSGAIERIHTGITLLTEDGPAYRGRPVAELLDRRPSRRWRTCCGRAARAPGSRSARPPSSSTSPPGRRVRCPRRRGSSTGCGWPSRRRAPSTRCGTTSTPPPWCAGRRRSSRSPSTRSPAPRPARATPHHRLSTSPVQPSPEGRTCLMAPHSPTARPSPTVAHPPRRRDRGWRRDRRP